MILPIRVYGDPALRRAARRVTDFDEELRRLAEDMVETMYSAHGLGLAAPQVGVSRRLFVALELAEPEPGDGVEIAAQGAHDAPEEADPDGGGPAADADGDAEPPAEEEAAPDVVHVMVNPEIVFREGEQIAPEGCLSLPGLSVEEMERDRRVRVRYQSLDGEHHEIEAEGHFAQVVQHEYDHLEGVLFFDRLSGRERQRFLEEHRAELADMQRRAKAFLKGQRKGPASGR